MAMSASTRSGLPTRRPDFLYLNHPPQEPVMQFFKSAVVTAVALCAALAVQARTLDEIKKDGKIIVATEGQFAPFNYFEGT